MAIGLRFDGVDDEVVIPDHADWDMADTEDLSMGFWSTIHPDAEDFDWISRENWWRFGMKARSLKSMLPYFTLHQGATAYFEEAAKWITKGKKHDIGLAITSPAIIHGDRTLAADTNTENHMIDSDGSDYRAANEPSYALAIVIRDTMVDHANDYGVGTEEHKTLDASAATLAAIPDGTDLTTLIALVTGIMVHYVIHDDDAIEVAPVIHQAQAAQNALASEVAPVSFAECITKLNDIKAKFTLHDADGASHSTADEYAVTATDASTGVGVSIGDIAYNLDDEITGVVTAVGAHDLTLDSDAFPDGDEVYLIIDEGSFFSFEMYVDGILRDTVAFSTPHIWPDVAATAIYFGSYITTSEFFLGDANELFIAAEVVSASVWLGLYNGGVELEALTGVTADGHWSFDEATGDTVDEDGGTAAKDGTVAGTTVWLTTIDQIVVKDGVIDFIHQDDYCPGWHKVLRGYWVGPTTNAHLLAITDWAGAPKVDLACITGTIALTVDLALPIWMNGVKVTDLDSGYVRLLTR